MAINVVFVYLPSKVRGTHTKNDDGSYTVFLNSVLTFECQQEAYLHEISHIIKNDLYSDEEADVIESLTHKEAININGKAVEEMVKRNFC